MGKEMQRVLEFYNGIGGIRYSLMKAQVEAQVIEAFEINNIANDVYQHNFSHRPYQGNIQSLTAADLDKYGAHASLLSPPCQPYTRQGLQKDTGDARAFSFLQILELIPFLLWPPSMLFVENVFGFETSDTHAKLIEIMEKTNFITQEFILSPLQFGVPYSRPCYFCLAKRKPSSFGNEFLSRQLIHNDTNVEPEASATGVSNDIYRTSGEDNEDEYDSLDKYYIHPSLSEKWGSAMDVIYPNSKRCCYFTKSYYRYVKGTGSLLATVQPMKRDKTPYESDFSRKTLP
ncbi:unnamed protein product [Vicia faba]|uniref:Uncharacterized protein n=1 Tax=Vicia faba TaxID=3906 RepID=A0AAV0Z617_VICFA|nr:unnamed protein product [Vicia faba]